MSKTFERHMMAIEAGEVGPAFIRGVKCAMNRADRVARGYGVSRAFSGMTKGELDALDDKIMTRPPRVAAAQSAKGLKFLQSRKIQKLLSEAERAIVRDYDHFTLAGWRDIGQHSSFMLPIYTVHAKSGKTFDYCAGSWQSGGHFETGAS